MNPLIKVAKGFTHSKSSCSLWVLESLNNGVEKTDKLETCIITTTKNYTKLEFKANIDFCD